MAKSIMNISNTCYFCGRSTPLHVHHCIHGTAGRQKAEEDGLKVNLCVFCHQRLHDSPEGFAMDRILQRDAQVTWMKVNGKTVDDWMERYGRNYE